MERPVFSGHETFSCKSHWLKRGYEFVLAGNDFNAEEAVVQLGVGKNMVSSIRFWMKAFGLLNQDGELTNIAVALLDDRYGYDPFFEDLGSLWLMHFNIIHTNYATVYKTVFVDYHEQREVLDRSKLQNFIKYKCFDASSYKNLYNENTIKKDISVLIHNYYTRGDVGVEESNTLLAPLNLIERDLAGEYMFNYELSNKVPADVLFYALLVSFPEDKSISFASLQRLGLIFCLTNNEILSVIKSLCDEYKGKVVFSDVAGIKEVQIKGNISPDKVLEHYYRQR